MSEANRNTKPLFVEPKTGSHCTIQEEFGEVEALIKAYILERGADMECYSIQCLIKEWCNIFVRIHGYEISDTAFKKMNIYKWMLSHYVLSEVTKQIGRAGY